VPTVTLTDCGPVPLIWTDAGKLQVGPFVTVGVIAQLKLSVPLSPPEDVRLRLKLAVWPAVIVSDGGEVGLREKSGAAWTMSNELVLLVTNPAVPVICMG